MNNINYLILKIALFIFFGPILFVVLTQLHLYLNLSVLFGAFIPKKILHIKTFRLTPKIIKICSIIQKYLIQTFIYCSLTFSIIIFIFSQYTILASFILSMFVLLEICFYFSAGLFFGDKIIDALSPRKTENKCSQKELEKYKRFEAERLKKDRIGESRALAYDEKIKKNYGNFVLNIIYVCRLIKLIAHIYVIPMIFVYGMLTMKDDD